MKEYTDKEEEGWEGWMGRVGGGGGGGGEWNTRIQIPTIIF